MAKKTVNQALDALGKKIVKDALAFPIPVDTGALKNSLKYQFQFISMEQFQLTFTQMYYGKYVNDGTYKMPARPYLSNAIEDNIDEGIQDIISTQIVELTDKLKYIDKKYANNPR